MRGFSRAIFSGLTTAALTDLVGDLLADHAGLSGLYHVAAEPIDKLALLTLVRDRLAADVAIEPDDAFAIDRSLDAAHFRAATGWTAPSWEEMVAALAADPTAYEELRARC